VLLPNRVYGKIMKYLYFICFFFVSCYTTPPCDFDKDCPTGSYCTSTGLCYTGGRDAALISDSSEEDTSLRDITLRCFTDDDCDPDETCLDNGECADLNRRCETFWQCKMDEYCDSRGRCSTLPSCTLPGDCPVNTHCSTDSLCAPGQGCISHWDCPTDFICTSALFCYPSPACQSSWDCPGGTWCIGGTCKRR